MKRTYRIGGHTVLIRREDEGAVSMPVRKPELDEIMTHLEKEDVK